MRISGRKLQRTEKEQVAGEIKGNGNCTSPHNTPSNCLVHAGKIKKLNASIQRSRHCYALRLKPSVIFIYKKVGNKDKFVEFRGYSISSIIWRWQQSDQIAKLRKERGQKIDENPESNSKLNRFGIFYINLRGTIFMGLFC